MLQTKDIEYQDGALNMRGLLAYDDALTGKRPGILVVHEAWGLGEHAMERAKMLAKEGYIALAADMYGDRRLASDLPQAMELIGELRTDPGKLRQRAKSALAALKAHPTVDGSRLAAIGLCFRGTKVKELAR